MSDITIGYQNSPQGTKPITIRTADQRSHLLVIGQTGTGKSTFSLSLAVQDIRNEAGVAVVDPHGDLVEALLSRIPRHRTNDVVYFDAAEDSFPVGMNILEVRKGQDKQLAASSLISIFKHLWASNWGPRSEYVLHNAVAALLDTPGSTLLEIYHLLIDSEFRRRVVSNCQDPMVRLYWDQVFARYTERFAAEVTSPVLNKVGQLLTGSSLRNIVGQAQSTIDFQDILDNQRIYLVSLPKGKIGEDRANLLGSVIITKLYLAALERQAVPEDQRKDFYLYADEYGSFATEIFPFILSESRKFHLGLCLIQQYLDQVARDITSGVFGNVGNWVVFRVGATDAQVLEPEFSPYIKLEQFRRQPNHRIIYKLLVTGVSAIPGMTTTPPPAPSQSDEADPATIIRTSRERYARSRGKVEQEILHRWNLASVPKQKGPRRLEP
jgi:hypothetical protein